MPTSTQVCQIIANQLFLPEVLATDRPYGNLHFDDLDWFELTPVLEEEFGIEIDTFEARQCATVADVIALIESKMREMENV